MIHITSHAKKQGKKRLRLKKDSLTKMALKAYNEGKCHSDVKGSLNRYLNKLWFIHKTANNMKIYNEHIWIFSGDTLITLWRIPNKYKGRN